MSLVFPDITEHESSQTTRVITSPDDLTPEWVTGVLHRNGVALESQASSVEVILQKELPISTVCRLAIGYKDPVDEICPRSLFLKLPRALSEGAKLPGVDDHAEVEFYNTIAPAIGCPPLVRCYDAAYSSASGRSHILLEDLMETHSQPEQEHAPSVEMSLRAVEALARAHAVWWWSKADTFTTRSRVKSEPDDLILSNYHPGIREADDGVVPKDLPASDKEWSLAHTQLSSTTPPLKRHPSYPGGELDLRRIVEQLNTSVTQFLTAADLTSVQEREYRRMLDAAESIWGRMTRREHLTVTHGDMHWWNFLYPKDPGSHAVHVFDWHLWHVDVGARDIAFLLALGGFAEPRPSFEEELLRAYHEALRVPDYSWEMLIEDYRWSAIRNLNIPVIFWSQGKHESTWRTALRRAFDAYERLACGSLIVDR